MVYMFDAMIGFTIYWLENYEYLDLQEVENELYLLCQGPMHNFLDLISKLQK